MTYCPWQLMVSLKDTSTSTVIAVTWIGLKYSRKLWTLNSELRNPNSENHKIWTISIIISAVLPQYKVVLALKSFSKIPSEIEVAPRYNCWHCWHCWHCSLLIDCHTQMSRSISNWMSAVGVKEQRIFLSTVACRGSGVFSNWMLYPGFQEN